MKRSLAILAFLFAFLACSKTPAPENNISDSDSNAQSLERGDTIESQPSDTAESPTYYEYTPGSR